MKRSTIHIRKLAVVCTMMVVLGTFFPINSAVAQDKINFLLGWKIIGPHAPFFLALEKGYFAEEKIEVGFTEGSGSVDVVKIIAHGTDFPIGSADYGIMIKAIARGLPLKAVFGIYQTSPFTVVSLAEAPIRNLQELAGKILATPSAASSDAQILPALFKKVGIDKNMLTIIHPSQGGHVPLLLQGRCDAITGYVNGARIQVEEQTGNAEYFLYADFGVNALSNGIVVNTEFLQSNPDVVARFLRAMARGWTEAKTDPAAAVEAMLKSYPDFQEKRTLYLKQLQATLPLLETPNTQGKPLGWMSEKDWEQTQELLFEYGGLEKKLPLETYYTNDYIPTAE